MIRSLLVVVVLAGLPALTRAADKLELIEARKIWSQAKHNAFTDLIRFKNNWYCVFREGQAHVSPDGALQVLTSADGKDWVSAARITSDTADLRDAKISITPGGQLMLSGAGALHDTSVAKHQSVSYFSDDGQKFSHANSIGDPNMWLWSVTWHKGTAYSVGYATKDRQFVRLYHSTTGDKFETLVDDLGIQDYPNESSLVFLPDDTALCLLRRDAGTKTGLLGSAKPPYRDWTWKDLGTRIGGPKMIQLEDGRLLAAVRLYDKGARTSLCWVNATDGTIEEALKLPSGGDTSYAGMVVHEGQLWMSYYSSHEGQTSIYLARVKF